MKVDEISEIESDESSWLARLLPNVCSSASEWKCDKGGGSESGRKRYQKRGLVPRGM